MTLKMPSKAIWVS